MTTPKMIQGVGGHKSLTMWKQLHKFRNWWPETIKCTWNWWQINCTSSRSFVRFFLNLWGRWRYVCSFYSVHSHGWAKGAQRHNLWRLHTCQTNPHILTCYQIFQYDSKTKCQSMEWYTKSSPSPKKIHWLKSRNKTIFITFLDKYKEFVPEGEQWTVNSMCRCCKCYWGRLRRRLQFQEKGIWFLPHTVPLLILLWQWSHSWQMKAWWKSASYFIHLILHQLTFSTL